MAMKDFDKKDLLVGGIALTLLLVGMVYASMFIYKLVGLQLTNILSIVAVLWLIWQSFYFHKNPKFYDRYLRNIHSALYAGEHSYRHRFLAYALNLSAMIALALLGWWFALIVGTCCSALIYRHFRAAAFIDHRAPAV